MEVLLNRISSVSIGMWFSLKVCALFLSEYEPRGLGNVCVEPAIRARLFKPITREDRASLKTAV